uniref:Uncharacterized protein n=1 Tax=Fagus sylvatica TaxID=28930 RepID=A0A2N9HS71_FAGSY
MPATHLNKRLCLGLGFDLESAVRSANDSIFGTFSV